MTGRLQTYSHQASGSLLQEDATSSLNKSREGSVGSVDETSSVKSVEQQEYEYVAQSRSFKKSLVLEDVMKAMELRTRSTGSHGMKSSFASA